VTSNENLYVSPSNAVAETPSVPVEGLQYITIGGIEGFVPQSCLSKYYCAPGCSFGKLIHISIRAVGSW